MHEQQAEEKEWGAGHANTTDGWRGRQRKHTKRNKKCEKNVICDKKKNMINKGNFKTKHEDTIVVLLVRHVKRQSKHTHQELAGLKHS